MIFTTSLCSPIGQKHQPDWVVQDLSTSICIHGNIVTLGGVNEEVGNGLRLEAPQPGPQKVKISWKYLNSVRETLSKC